jgi:hypothetical protein
MALGFRQAADNPSEWKSGPRFAMMGQGWRGSPMRRLVTIDLGGADLALFEAYEAKVLPLVEQHAGRVEFRVRALDQSSETHLLYFPDAEAYEAYRADPRRQAVQDEWRRCGASSSAVDVEIVLSR